MRQHPCCYSQALPLSTTPWPVSWTHFSWDTIPSDPPLYTILTRTDLDSKTTYSSPSHRYRSGSLSSHHIASPARYRSCPGRSACAQSGSTCSQSRRTDPGSRPHRHTRGLTVPGFASLSHNLQLTTDYLVAGGNLFSRA